MKWFAVCREQAQGVKPGDPTFTGRVSLGPPRCARSRRSSTRAVPTGAATAAATSSSTAATDRSARPCGSSTWETRAANARRKARAARGQAQAEAKNITGPLVPGPSGGNDSRRGRVSSSPRSASTNESQVARGSDASRGAIAASNLYTLAGVSGVDPRGSATHTYARPTCSAAGAPSSARVRVRAAISDTSRARAQSTGRAPATLPHG
jgi:hypothetical protein